MNVRSRLDQLVQRYEHSWDSIPSERYGPYCQAFICRDCGALRVHDILFDSTIVTDHPKTWPCDAARVKED